MGKITLWIKWSTHHWTRPSSQLLRRQRCLVSTHHIWEHRLTLFAKQTIEQNTSKTWDRSDMMKMHITSKYEFKPNTLGPKHTLQYNDQNTQCYHNTHENGEQTVGWKHTLHDRSWGLPLLSVSVGWRCCEIV